MKKILFINNALSGTGGARVILNLAKVLADRGNSISILLDRADNIQYEIDANICVYVRKGNKIIKVQDFSGHNSTGKILVGNKFPRLRMIKNITKKIINYYKFLIIPYQLKGYKEFVENKKFDLIVNNNIYLNLDRSYYESKLTCNYVFNFHNSPSEVFARSEFSHVLSLSKIFSQSTILTVSNDIACELKKIRAFKNNRIHTIYNPFDFCELIEKSYYTNGSLYPLPNKYIITVSTLTPRKRVERSIRAFYEIKKNHPDFKLVILGEGELYSKHLNDVRELGLENEVVFLGFQKNPYYYISNAKLLMLTSDSEGLPTVLIESLILGVPVISTDCPTGPAEILQGWGNDFLVKLNDGRSEEDIINDLAVKASNIISESFTNEEVALRSKLHRFEQHNIAKQWEGLTENYD
ncbi:TPA: glycosyltransferase [Enterobacter hormaechei]|nr:glycosyltransferase [Enterobacter hormaechei]